MTTQTEKSMNAALPESRRLHRGGRRRDGASEVFSAIGLIAAAAASVLVLIDGLLLSLARGEALSDRQVIAMIIAPSLTALSLILCWYLVTSGRRMTERSWELLSCAMKRGLSEDLGIPASRIDLLVDDPEPGRMQLPTLRVDGRSVQLWWMSPSDLGREGRIESLVLFLRDSDLLTHMPKQDGLGNSFASSLRTGLGTMTYAGLIESASADQGSMFGAALTLYSRARDARQGCGDLHSALKELTVSKG